MAKGKEETKNMTAAKAKDMPARARILGLRIAVRHRREEGKRLNGRVSEAKTDFENKLKMAVPDDGEEAKQRLRDLQLAHEEISSRKDKRAAFKSTCKETETALLFAEIREDGQTYLPGIELDMTAEMARHLKAGANAVKAADQAARDGADDEKAPDYPIEDAAAVDAFAADLDLFIKEAGLSSSSLGVAEDTAKGGAANSATPKDKRARKGAAEQPSAVH